MRCPKCGMESDGKFCPGCGYPLTGVQCLYCGKHFTGEICPYCGKREDPQKRLDFEQMQKAGIRFKPDFKPWEIGLLISLLVFALLYFFEGNFFYCLHVVSLYSALAYFVMAIVHGFQKGVSVTGDFLCIVVFFLLAHWSYSLL